MPHTPERGAVPPLVGEVVAMAHRGAHTAGPPPVPENTLGAFTAARDLGYRWAETDLRATADGVPVLAHDASLARTAGLAQDVSRATAAQLARVLLGGVAPVPTLEEVLDAAPGLQLNVDVKASDAVAPLAALLGRRPDLVARLRVTSFSEVRRSRVVAAVRSAGLGPVRSSASAPGVLACWLVCSAPLPRWARRAAVAAVARGLGVDSLQLPESVVLRAPGGLRAVLPVLRPALVDAAHAAGLEVHVWTVDDPERMHRLLDAGVDGIVTDAPAALVAVLTDRGQWPPGGGDQRPRDPAAPTGGQP